MRKTRTISVCAQIEYNNELILQIPDKDRIKVLNLGMTWST